jgi:hypothetical protein
MRADADFFCLPVEKLYFDKLKVSIDYDLSFSLDYFNFISFVYSVLACVVGIPWI